MSVLTACFIQLTPLPALTAEPVTFASASNPPSPFRQKLAREKGEVLKPEPGIQLNGFLTLPDGEGPFPAVVLMHGCAGMGQHMRNWAGRLSNWGYASLAVDSFTARGIDNTCNRLLADRVYDAYGALDYLATRPGIDPTRIAIMGFSAGGIAVLQTVQLDAVEPQMPRKFRAAIAWYPTCSPQFADVSIPTLIQIGELDDWTPAQPCREMMTLRTGKGSSLDLQVYANAHHAFDNPALKTGVMSHDHFPQYNAESAGLAFKDTRVFLDLSLAK